MNLCRRLISLTFLCLYLIILGFLCFANTQGYPSPEFHLWNIPTDKILHFLMFLPYPILVYLVIDNNNNQTGTIAKTLIAILGIGIIIAYGTEYAQKLTNYRTFEILDWVADSIGMLAGTAILCIYVFLRNKLNRQDDNL